MSDWTHPASGRVYREGDPAHHFAVLAAALANQARDFVDHFERRLDGRDYLEQHQTWQSDPDRIARNMANTIAALDKAYTAVIVNRDAHCYGLGTRDAEWERKYGASQDGQEARP